MNCPHCTFGPLPPLKPGPRYSFPEPGREVTLINVPVSVCPRCQQTVVAIPNLTGLLATIADNLGRDPLLLEVVQEDKVHRDPSTLAVLWVVPVYRWVVKNTPAQSHKASAESDVVHAIRAADPNADITLTLIKNKLEEV